MPFPPNAPQLNSSATPAAAALAGSGEMAALVHAKDWSQTPLGPMEQWPQSLRTTVSLCLASNFPINIAWGPGRVQIYNDGYRPLCGDKHPTSLGQDYKECWASAWDVLGEDFEQASAGQTRFLENQRMFLDRCGYLEETFFTFSFSPILDESGGVGGLFHPVTELTQQSLAERRLNILRTLTEQTGAVKTEQDTVARLLDTLREFDLDLPFVLLYAAAPDGRPARLAGTAGVPEHSVLAPATVALDGEPGPWPLAEASRLGAAQRVQPLAAAVGDFASGPYPEAPTTALVYPMTLAGAPAPDYYLVVGVSARRALDAEYALFFDLLAGSVTTALAKARALGEARKGAEMLAELDQAKTAFFSNISHEFCTPLTLMVGPLEDALADAAQPLPDAAGPTDAAEDEGEIFAATLLVVDHNADMRAYVQRILSQHPQWTVHLATDGLHALEMIREHRPDLVLSDVMMPRLDGFGLLRQLKANPETATIPVVMLSARAGEEATLAGLSRGADDYLMKPFSARELVARVRTQLTITRTRQANSRLQASAEELRHFQVMSDHAFDAFILMRADGSFAYLNDLALQRWGYTREEVPALRVPDVDPLYQAGDFRALFATLQQQGALGPLETLHRRKDGSTFPVEVTLRSLTLQGEPHLLAIARDITEQVAARQQLEQREQEAQALAAEVATTNDHLRRTNADLDNFIYTASHDLKAPISNIEGLLGTLADELPAAYRVGEVSYILELMQGSVDRFKRTIEHLTDISRLQKEHGEAAGEVDLGAVVENVRLDLVPLLRETGAELMVAVESSPLRFSEKNLRSVVYNLLSNALKYRDPERRLCIGLRCESVPGYHALQVRDNGLGIEPERREQVFGMFKRFHDHVEGSGIGLYMVKKMVENVGGRIEVESAPGVGSTFTVYIPR